VFDISIIWIRIYHPMVGFIFNAKSALPSISCRDPHMFSESAGRVILCWSRQDMEGNGRSRKKNMNYPWDHLFIPHYIPISKHLILFSWCEKVIFCVVFWRLADMVYLLALQLVFRITFPEVTWRCVTLVKYLMLNTLISVCYVTLYSVTLCGSQLLGGKYG
jgi:hypothetical protein